MIPTLPNIQKGTVAQSILRVKIIKISNNQPDQTSALILHQLFAFHDFNSSFSF